MSSITITFKDPETKEVLRTAEVDMFVVAMTDGSPVIDIYVDKSNPLVVPANIDTGLSPTDTVNTTAITEAAPEEPKYIATTKMGECTIGQYLEMKWSYAQMLDEGLIEEITDVDVTETVPAQEPAGEPEYVGTDKLGEFSIEQYLASKWTYEMLLEAGMIELVVAEPAAPEVPVEVEAPPVADVLAEDPVLNAKANGATYAQFVEQGWTYDTLVENGYIDVEPATTAAPAAPAAAAAADDGEWPRKDGDDWIDSSGEVWNPDKHSTPKDTTLPPPVTKKGIFNKRRGGTKADAAPAAPVTSTSPAPAAPAAPAAPDAAPAAPPVGPDDAPPAPPVGGEDPELADLIKEWGPKK